MGEWDDHRETPTGGDVGKTQVESHRGGGRTKATDTSADGEEIQTPGRTEFNEECRWTRARGESTHFGVGRSPSGE